MNQLKARIISCGEWKTSRAFARYMTDRYGAGWDEGMISRLACGICWPTADRLKLLCRELDCLPCDIYDADELRQMAQTGLDGLAGLSEKLERMMQDDEEQEDQ